MPICRIEAPPGISPEAKKKMMEKITAAIDEGYNHIGDTFVFLHEDQPDNVMMNGRLQSENPKFGALPGRHGA
jgi:phenylpyruvate tautomerase PptA (4-oxalocrotonate tautomerase family)